VARILNFEELPLALRLIMQKFEGNVLSAPENRDAPIA